MKRLFAIWILVLTHLISSSATQSFESEIPIHEGIFRIEESKMPSFKNDMLEIADEFGMLVEEAEHLEYLFDWDVYFQFYYKKEKGKKNWAFTIGNVISSNKIIYSLFQSGFLNKEEYIKFRERLEVLISKYKLR